MSNKIVPRGKRDNVQQQRLPTIFGFMIIKKTMALVNKNILLFSAFVVIIIIIKEASMEQYLSEILTALVSISVSYGVIKTKVANMERKIERFDKDHDLLVELNTKIDMLLKQRGKK